VATVSQHLERLFKQGEPIDINNQVGPEKREEIESLFHTLGAEKLTPVVNELQGRVTYEEARIVRGYMEARKAAQDS
jgi:hypothetical protein